MKFNRLEDYLSEHGFSYVWLQDADTFGKIYLNGKLYPVYLSLSMNIPDDLCFSVRINRKIYRFSELPRTYNIDLGI